MPVTIKDIAKQAGVSHTTVSRALNGNSVIPEKTAATIRELAGKMGYLPSAAARGLKTKRSGVLGVIVSRIDNPYFGEIVQGIEDALQGTGYSIFVASSNLDEGHERTIIQAFGEHRVDGVIIGSVSFTRKHTSILEKYSIPIVVINNQAPRDYLYSISHDDLFGAQQVTDHLLALGHTRIGFIGNSRASRINRDRLRGFEKTLRSAGISIPPQFIQNQAGSEIENGAEGMAVMLQLTPKPTAVFCFNDLMAIGALKKCQTLGIDVPGEISLTGFDNIPYSAYTTPALTTFDQPKRTIGFEATKLMLDLISGDFKAGETNQPTLRSVRGKLLIRESTAENTNKEGR